MSDIVERLEASAVSYEQSGPSAHHTAALLREAADEIDRLHEQLADQIKLNEMEIHAALICKADADQLRANVDELEDALHKIDSWSRAYPLDIFPEPDWKKARALLKAGGMTLDAISAHCMRHVVEGIGRIAREALKE